MKVRVWILKELGCPPSSSAFLSALNHDLPGSELLSELLPFSPPCPPAIKTVSAVTPCPPPSGHHDRPGV